MRRAGVAVAALTVLLVACRGTATETTGENGRLLVTGTDGSVIAIDPVDTSVEVLRPAPPTPPAVVQPTASPDGSVVVWSEESGGVTVAGPAGTRTLETGFVPFYFAFDPTGAKLVMLANAPGGVGATLVELDSDTLLQAGQGTSFFLDFEPGGNRMIANVGGAGLLVVGPAGDTEPLGLPAGSFAAPDWLDDGRVVVATSAYDPGTTAALYAPGVPTTQAAGSRIVTVRPGTDEVGVVASVQGRATLAADPGGERLALVDTALGSPLTAGPLRVVSLSSGDPVEVHPGPVTAFQWSPDGSYLWFLELTGPGVVPHLWDGSTVRDYPAFRPTATFVGQYLPFWDQYSRSLTLWSPDSSAFAFAASDGDGVSRVYVQPRDGDRRVVGEGEFVSWTAAPG